MIVTLFLLTVIGLLIGAAIKTRLEIIGINSSAAWASGRSWWEVSVTLKSLQLISFDLPFLYLAATSFEAGRYVPA